MSNVSKLRSCIDKTRNEAGAIPQLIGQDPEENLTSADKDIYQAEESVTLKAEAEDPEEQEIDEPTEDAENTDAEEEPENKDQLDADLASAEEETEDINENIVVFLYRAFSEIGDTVRVYVEDEENEERDADLVQILTDMQQGLPDVMAVIKELAKAYVHSVDLFDPEEEEEVTDDEEPTEDTEELDVEDIESEDNLEDETVVESYIKESKVEFKKFENEYQIFARYTTLQEASKFESELNSLKGAEVFNYPEIGEVHAFVNVK